MKTHTYAQQIFGAQALYWAQRDRKKPRRKKAWHEHKGVAYYDRERMRQPLAPIVHPRDFQGWSTPLPSWIDPNWKAPAETAVQRGDDFDDPPIAQTADYTLERCHVQTVCSYRNPVWYRAGQPELVHRRAVYRWELTFADGATFQFVSRAIAEAALSELLTIRKAKHPRPKYGKHSPENDCVFFTERKRAKLPADYVPDETPASVSAA